MYTWTKTAIRLILRSQIPIRLSHSKQIPIPLRQRNGLNRGLPANRRVSITNQGKNIGIQNRISKKVVLISRRTNVTLPISEIFPGIKNRPGSKLHVIPMGSNILTEQDSRILGTKMIMAVHFPIGTGSIGKMEQDFSLLLPDGLLRNPNKR